MVPVSHLLLTLNNLTIQADRDARLAELYQEELAVAQRKVAIRESQAKLWRTYGNELCNLVHLAALDDYPGSNCEVSVPDSLPKAGAPLRCTLGTLGAAGNAAAEAGAGARTIEVENCILTRPWRSLLTERLARKSADGALVDDPRQKRAAYEAAAAYLQLRLNAYETSAEEFRRIDVLHRRTAVIREAALLQWKNLVAVPADELNGYYAGGIKPAELADLIVKAVGFAAIAIGVAQ
jgi:hypothetical protein